jgi:hypothetical protein
VNDALWGLSVWLRLVSVDVVSAQACGRAAIFPLLLSWFRASSVLVKCSPRLYSIIHSVKGSLQEGSAVDGEGQQAADFTHPLLQARLALLLHALAPHAMATSDIRHLFQLLQPVVLAAGAHPHATQACIAVDQHCES